MRNDSTRKIALALLAGTVLLIGGCGGSDEAANATDSNALDANLMLDQPGNDASAMESMANATEPMVTETGNQGTDATDVLGNTSGGDTGGNTVGGNVSAM